MTFAVAMTSRREFLHPSALKPNRFWMEVEMFSPLPSQRAEIINVLLSKLIIPEGCSDKARKVRLRIGCILLQRLFVWFVCWFVCLFVRLFVC